MKRFINQSLLFKHSVPARPAPDKAALDWPYAVVIVIVYYFAYSIGQIIAYEYIVRAYVILYFMDRKKGKPEKWLDREVRQGLKYIEKVYKLAAER